MMELNYIKFRQNFFFVFLLVILTVTEYKICSEHAILVYNSYFWAIMRAIVYL